MTNLFPGAEWRPMPGQEKRPLRRKGRGVGFHVAVYSGPSIYDINLRTGNDAHLYVRLDGSVEQNVDLDLQAWAGADGNPSMIWVETAGGVNPKTVNTEPWPAAQAATLARIARYAHDTEGTPLQLMPDSRPTSRGIGTHRLGITHSRGIGAVPGFRVVGGESWSNVISKECPGDAKVAQVPGIVAAAISSPPTSEEDDMKPILANDGTGKVWIGDFMTRRHIADETELKNVQYWLAQTGGNSQVQTIKDIRILGVDVTDMARRDDVGWARDQIAGWVGADPEKKGSSELLDDVRKVSGSPAKPA